MKKLAIGFVAVVSVIIMCLSLAACGASLEGTYKFSSMSVTEGGTTMEIKAGEPVLGILTYNEDAIVLTADGDGTFTLVMSIMGIENNVSGSWENRDGKFYLTIDGDEQEATLDGKNLTFSFEEDGSSIKMVLKKQ